MRITCLFITIFIFCHTGYSQREYDEALKKYYAGEFSVAIDLFTKCISNKDNNSLAYMYRGISKAFSGSFSDAFRDLNESLRIDSLNDKIYYYFGKAYLLDKEYFLAKEYFIKSIAKKNNDPERYDALATAEMFLGEFKDAVENEDRAIQLDSRQSDYFSNRGFAKLKLNRFEGSIDDLSKALSIEKNDKAYSNRALAYSQLKMYSKAIEDYNSSLAINPENAEVIYFRGLAYKYMGATDKSCLDFKRSAELGFPDALKALNLFCKP